MLLICCERQCAAGTPMRYIHIYVCVCVSVGTATADKALKSRTHLRMRVHHILIVWSSLRDTQLFSANLHIYVYMFVCVRSTHRLTCEWYIYWHVCLYACAVARFIPKRYKSLKKYIKISIFKTANQLAYCE